MTGPEETEKAEGETSRPPLKVAIFGTTPSRMEGPTQDNSGWQRWTIGPGGKDAHNWDRLYEVHTVWPENFKGYLNDLSKETREVWSLVPMKERLQTWWKKEHKKTDEQFAADITGDWATNKVLDSEAMLNKHGSTWLSSSISWLMAHAIEEGATEIGLWGIDLESGEEYIPQFIGCRHFMDVCRLYGIKVTVPAGSGLARELRHYPARFETHQALHMERKANYLAAMGNQLAQQHDQARIGVFRLEGVLLALRKHGLPAEAIKEAEEELLKYQIDESRLMQEVCTVRGEANGTEYWRKMYVYGLRDPETPPV